MYKLCKFSTGGKSDELNIIFERLSLLEESQRASIVGRLKKNSEDRAKNFFV
tara:strand:+ start:1130 stop:1285 length:156 start_codon:yes stop_codon:yes gene_type:complete